MIPRSELRAARAAPDRAARIRDLAALMREHRHGAEGGLSLATARAAGFTLAEIEAYRDAATALARSGAPVVLAPPRKRALGLDLVRKAQAIRRRLAGDAAGDGA